MSYLHTVKTMLKSRLNKPKGNAMNHQTQLTRRTFLQTSAATAGSLAIGSQQAFSQEQPNVILIITDDQGYGDIGVHGNKKIKTPNMDRFANESVAFDRFYVCPVCAPTRACLMTGRYNYRTGVVDTYLGRAMMHNDEITMAEVFKNSGYATGIFGKWHLGDNYPLRPSEQGFDEVLVHKGGGIGQPSDPPGNSYDNPILFHNNKPFHYKGYCTDIFTDATIEFIKKNREKPFFAYLSTNAPHTPLEIDKRYVQPYLDMGLDETTAKVYGMVENIDENLGRLMHNLNQYGLDENTIVIFMTDNGPQQKRYTANLRGRKGSVYEGGIRVPCFIRWPKKLKAGKEVKPIAAHIDMLPTLIAACGLKQPENKLDGINLMPVLEGQTATTPDRTLFTQWHRGDEPEKFRACAAWDQRYKLINGKELYDIQNDPYEKHDIADQNPDIVERLRQDYLDWFRDVSGTRGYAPPRIYIGTKHENPVILTRQDWRGPHASWGKKGLGYWEVDIRQTASYNLTLRIHAAGEGDTAHVKCGDTHKTQKLQKGATHCVFPDIPLQQGEGRLEAWIDTGKEKIGVRYLDVLMI
ncbi:sulfatase-like hydrolase/transferase [bacterium]|nr:sulfatase-like hydrolase/transferase [bacterium]